MVGDWHQAGSDRSPGMTAFGAIKTFSIAGQVST
jgi:hypothetical protein